MAGTLTLSTLSDGSTSTSATNVINGSAKAWVNFNGSTASIRASYNVSSVTRNSTGNYTISYTNSLPNANYSLVVTPYDNSSGVTNAPATYISSLNTSNSVIITGYYSSGVFDPTYVCASVFD